MASSVRGADELAAALSQGAEKLPRLMATVVEKCAGDLVAATQINASHRPGPNAPTGDYRGSWKAEPVMAPANTVAWSAGTDRPQAMRLEYGFGGDEAVNTVGIDSLGRHYHQDPLPHHGPAVDVIGPKFDEAMAKVAEQATSW